MYRGRHSRRDRMRQGVVGPSSSEERAEPLQRRRVPVAHEHQLLPALLRPTWGDHSGKGGSRSSVWGAGP